MNGQDLVNALREHAEWAEGNQWETPITLCDDLVEAADRIEAQAQITMVFEEMAELQDVLCKFLRGRVDGDTLANIAEEIADCDSCVYAPCLCGNDPENCVAYVMRTSDNG